VLPGHSCQETLITSPLFQQYRYGSAERSSRRRVGLSALALAAALITGILLQFRPQGRSLEGFVYVVDGDTVRMGDVAIRLEGLDAPELDQVCRKSGFAYRCGETARAALIRLIGGVPVRCRTSAADRYGRSLARCSVGERDLGAALVEQGDAVAYGDYEREEARARAHRVGLWAGAFEEPSLWRQTR
jgi:endonuclease YncB( thermonuclease family)